MESLEVQERSVPRVKGLISGKLELTAQGSDSTFTFRHAHLKKAILHYKIEFGQRLLHRTVANEVAKSEKNFQEHTETILKNKREHLFTYVFSLNT